MATVTTSSCLDAYTYQSLDDSSQEFRLLQVSSVDPNANRVECSLTAFRIDEAPPYLALSYAWGPADEQTGDNHRVPSCSVSISSDHADAGYMNVTENLYLVLQELHRRSKHPEASLAVPQGTHLWIDALCIDQSNMDERIRQVRIMDQIYSLASSVIVWLGPDADDSMPTVVDMMTKCETLSSALTTAFTDKGIDWMENLHQNNAQLLSACGLPEIKHASWTKFVIFFERRWFSRLWVVQELALARGLYVFCGKSTLQWSQIEVSSQILFSGLQFILNTLKPTGHYTISSRSCMSISSVRRWCSTGALPSSNKAIYFILTGTEVYDPQNALAVILFILGRQRCTERRDRMFAVLGILKKITSSSRALLDADYTSSPAYVYTEATQAMLQRTNWLGFCCAFSAIRSENPLSLPSWVPQYESSKHTLNVLGFFRETNFNAAGLYLSTDSQPAQNLKYLDNQLGFTGCRVAVVKTRSEVLSDLDQRKTRFEAGLQLILDLGDTYCFTGQSVLEAYWRTLVVDTFQNATSSDMMTSFASWWLHKWVAMAGDRTGAAVDEYLGTIPNVDLLSRTAPPGVLADHEAIKSTLSGNVDERDALVRTLRRPATLFGTTASYWTIGRRLFSTEDGHIGSAIHTLQEGDEIWISPRARTPFILRKIPDAARPSHFAFVGECYVHGLMDGEAFRDVPPLWQEAWLE